MAILLNTSLGDLVIDLHTDHCPLASKNFIKLCKIKYYNNCLFHTVHKDFIVQTGDPSGTGSGGDSIYKHLYGEQARFFNDEFHQKLKHDKAGTVAMASAGENLNASQFYITTRDGLDYLDGKHTVFGEVAEGLETLMRINEAYVDERGRPFKNIRIKHTYVLDDPFDDPKQLTELIPEKSPELVIPAEGEDVRLEDDWIPMDEQLGKEELEQSLRRNEAHSRAVVLEMVGDIPEAEIKPPETVLFVCKLNPVTQEEDLEIIFSRFGKIISADIIRDYKTGDSLCYAFIEFETQEACEAAYFKMDNVLIDDRRVHVDFSQSVAKLWTRYHRFGNKDKNDGEGTNFAPKVRGEGCLKCGEDGHFAKDCPNAAVKERLQLKNLEGQHGGSDKRYEMLFEETSDEANKYGKRKEKSSRKHYHEKESSEEERTDRISGLLQSKALREKTHRSKEQENSHFGSRRYISAMEEKGKERREEHHVHAKDPDGRYLHSHSKNIVDENKNRSRKDYHRHHDRGGRNDVSGMKRSSREEGPDEKILQRRKEQKSTHRDQHWHGEHRHNKSRSKKEERSKPGNKEIKHYQAKYRKDVVEYSS